MEANYFTILQWFLPYIDMNQLWHVSPILNPPPTSLPIPSLRVVPVHQLWCPASCIELGLVIYFTYGNIHVSMLCSQIISPNQLILNPPYIFPNLNLPWAQKILVGTQLSPQ